MSMMGFFLFYSLRLKASPGVTDAHSSQYKKLQLTPTHKLSRYEFGVLRR